MSVHGRMSLMLAPQAAPGTCAGCGKATDSKGFVDTDLSFEFFGAVIFCSDCTFEMASMYGYIKPETADLLKSQVNALEVELANHRAAILGLEETVDGLLKVRNSGVSDITNNTEPEPNTEPVQPETQEETSEPEEELSDFGSSFFAGTGTSFTDGNSTSDDTSVEQVPIGVSSSSGNDLPEFDF